jgi:hypothetical protein
MPASVPQTQRIVVTGLGAVTPLGLDLPTTWRRLIAGEDAATPVTIFDVSGCRCKNGGQATLPESRRWSRATELALPAARAASASICGQMTSPSPTPTASPCRAASSAWKKSVRAAQNDRHAPRAERSRDIVPTQRVGGPQRERHHVGGRIEIHVFDKFVHQFHFPVRRCQRGQIRECQRHELAAPHLDDFPAGLAPVMRRLDD